MTLHQLKIFAAVAKVGSFTQVAKNLRLSQPSVSLLIQSLQRELEVKLFERLGVKSHLTEAGRRVLQLAESALATIEKIPEEVEEVKGLKKGRIRVGGGALAAASFLPVAVQEFKKENPGIEVILKVQRSDHLQAGLLEGEIDLAILVYPPRSPLLVGEAYRDEEVVVIAPPRHPLTKKRSVPLELIAKEPLIIHEKGALVRDMVEQRFAEKGLSFQPALEVDFQFGARDVIRKAVESGLGLGFLSESQVEVDIKAGLLKILKTPELDLKRTLYIAVHRNRQNLSLIQSFRDFLIRSKGQ